MMDLGTFVSFEGRPAVRFVRTYPHPPERIWAALTEPDQVRHWFPSQFEMDLRRGGTVHFSGDPYTEDLEGVVLVCDPPRALAFTWGTSELHFELADLGAAGCRFSLVDVLGSADEAARNGAGWVVCLHELERTLAGHPGAGPHDPGALEWGSLYEAHVAAGLPSGAPVPD
jgi:uncharacterized protein YndB with AHSA1/START domain